MRRWGPVRWNVRGGVVIADGEVGKIEVVKRLTEGCGVGVVIRVAEVFFVVFREQTHVIGG